jgi:hypothetical protein
MATVRNFKVISDKFNVNNIYISNITEHGGSGGKASNIYSGGVWFDLGWDTEYLKFWWFSSASQDEYRDCTWK